jgi:hypothetical protein
MNQSVQYRPTASFIDFIHCKSRLQWHISPRYVSRSAKEKESRFHGRRVPRVCGFSIAKHRDDKATGLPKRRTNSTTKEIIYRTYSCCIAIEHLLSVLKPQSVNLRIIVDLILYLCWYVATPRCMPFRTRRICICKPSSDLRFTRFVGNVSCRLNSDRLICRQLST